MPVRIYALAKDLEVDSKELVELCAKAGIAGKGSALASLDDEEVQKVKAYIAQKSPPAPPPPSAPKAPVRSTAPPPRVPPVIPAIIPSTPAPVVPPPVASPTPPAAPGPLAATSGPLAGGSSGSSAAPGSRSVRPTPPVAPPAEPPTPPPPPKKESPVVAQKPPAAPTKPAPLAPQSDLKGARREDMGSLSGKVRVLDARRGLGSSAPSKPGPEGDASPAGKGGARKRRDPVINLASMPAVKQPVAAPSQVPSQKPEIRLSKDLIAGTKQGKKAPLEQLVQEQQKSATRKERGGPVEAAPVREKGKAKRGARDAIPEEEGKAGRKTLAGMASARADRGKGRRKTQEDEIDKVLARVDEGRRGRRTLTRRGTNTAAPRKDKIEVELPCSIRAFSEAAGVPASKVLRSLMGMGMMLNINAPLDVETAHLLAADLDLDLVLQEAQTLEDDFISDIETQVDTEESLVTRPPIVTFLGHVDHGKTSLIDKIIGTRIVSGEAGGITQHIRSYQVEKDGRKVTFVDTPGHEAFTDMRARGANVTDIAVLVIAADDGIMPQTEEAISHIKAAGVPIVVALNKVDLPGVDLNRPLTQLTEYQLTPSEWGGDVEVVRTSATTGQGIDELLETLLTVAELHEYRANPNRQALGVCLESQQLGDKGVVAKLVVKNGTLRPGDILVCGSAHGRVRAMTDPLTNKPLKEAPPSTPVNITGLDEAPGAGDRFHVLDDITVAREIAEKREESSRSTSLSGNSTRVSFEHFQQMLQDGNLGPVEERSRLNLIIRADTRGSLEAIDKELSKLQHPEVEIRILQRSVGGITVADVTLASASQAVIVGFNVIPDESARSLADERNVEIRRYEIIYKLADEIKLLLEGRLKPEERVVELGRALVKQTFPVGRSIVIAGCYVIQGSIERGCRIRVNRDGRTIGDYPLESLRRIKDDVKEVSRGLECGIKLVGFNDIKQDDVLEAYRIEEVARKFD